MTIGVTAYDPTWPATFELIAQRVRALVSGLPVTVEHVGSTAVPGLAAKPIIDIDVVVSDPADVPGAIKGLEAGAYVHRGDLGIPGREAFDSPPDLPYHHLYVVVAGTKPHQDHVLLRDYLRAQPEAAGRYARKKLELAHLITADGREAYQQAKAELIGELLEEAREAIPAACASQAPR